MRTCNLIAYYCIIIIIRYIYTLKEQSHQIGMRSVWQIFSTVFCTKSTVSFSTNTALIFDLFNICYLRQAQSETVPLIQKFTHFCMNQIKTVIHQYLKIF